MKRKRQHASVEDVQIEKIEMKSFPNRHASRRVLSSFPFPNFYGLSKISRLWPWLLLVGYEWLLV